MCKRDQFAWEYKSKGANLDQAFDQLLQYADDLGNPPLLIVCDFENIVIRTRFNGYPPITHTITLLEFEKPAKFAIVRNAFKDVEALRPARTVEDITKAAVAQFEDLAESTKRWPKAEQTAFAHFLTRLVFCMYAEDAKLLPEKLVGGIFHDISRDPRYIHQDIRGLFAAMALGGSFWGHGIRHFDGGLFDGTPAIDLAPNHFATIKELCTFDWSHMDCSIFGTLFERVMDESKRSQLGAHYTSAEDIATLVEPVVLEPLRREWKTAQGQIEALLPFDLEGDATAPKPATLKKAQAVFSAFLTRPLSRQPSPRGEG